MLIAVTDLFNFEGKICPLAYRKFFTLFHILVTGCYEKAENHAQ